MILFKLIAFTFGVILLVLVHFQKPQRVEDTCGEWNTAKLVEMTVSAMNSWPRARGPMIDGKRAAASEIEMVPGSETYNPAGGLWSIDFTVSRGGAVIAKFGSILSCDGYVEFTGKLPIR